MTKSRRTPQRSTTSATSSASNGGPTHQPEEHGPFGNSVLNAALSTAFGSELTGLSAETGSTAPSFLGGNAMTEGRSMTFGPNRNPDRLDDWDAMKTVGEEVAHALAGGGSGQTWLDQPDDPGEESARDSGAKFADFMVGGGPVPDLQPAFGGKARIHRDSDVDEDEEETREPARSEAPDLGTVDAPIVDRIQADQMHLIESASDRTQALAADSDANARPGMRFGGLQGDQTEAGFLEIRNGQITGGIDVLGADGDVVSSGYNLMNGQLTLGDAMVGPGAASFGGYGFDNGAVTTPYGSFAPQLSLGLEEQAFRFATDAEGTTSAALTTTSDRTIGADLETKFVDFGFTDSDLREDTVYFDDMDGRDFDDMREAREAVFGRDEDDAAGLEGTLDAFANGRAGDQFSNAETERNSLRFGLQPSWFGVGVNSTDEFLRENTYQNLGEGADGSHLVMISTMEYAAQGAGIELDASVAAVDGQFASADVIGYSAVVDINTTQGQSDLLLHQTLGLPPQSVQAADLGLAEDATPAEVAERVAEFAALVESGDLAENPPDWLDTSDPAWLETLGEMPEFIAEQDPDAMREAGYLSAVHGDSEAARFEATALTASLGTSEYVSSEFHHTFVDGDGSRSLIQTLSEHSWDHIFGGSGETGSRSEVEGTQAAITMLTNEDGRIEDLLENGTVNNREVWDHMRSDDNDGLISDVILQSDLTFDLESLAAAGVEADELDLSQIDSIMDPFFSKITSPHDDDAIFDYEGIDGWEAMSTEFDHDAMQAVRPEIDAIDPGDDILRLFEANNVVELRAMGALGIDLQDENAQAQLDAWAAQHAPQGMSTEDFLMSTFEQTHQFVTGQADLGELDDPVAAVQLFVGGAVMHDEETALAALPVLHQLDPQQQTEALASILRAAGPDMGQDILDWATENGIDTQATHTAVAQTERFTQIADTRERNRGEAVGDFMEEMEGLDEDLRAQLIGDFAQQTTVVEGVSSTNGWAATLAMADDDQMGAVFEMLAADPDQQLAVAEAVLANPEEYFSDEMSEEDRRAFLETYVTPVATRNNPNLLNTQDVLDLADFNRHVNAADWNQAAPDEDALAATAEYAGMDPQTARLLTGIDNGDVDLQAVMESLPPEHPLAADLGRFLTQNPDGTPLDQEQMQRRLNDFDIEGENAMGVLQAVAATGASPDVVADIFDRIIDDVDDPQQMLDMVQWLRDNAGADIAGRLVDTDRIEDTNGLTDEEILALGAEVRDHEQDRDGFGVTWWSPDTEEMAEIMRGVAQDDEQSRLLIEGYAANITNGDDITNILKATDGEPHIQALAAQILIDGGHMTRDEIDAWYEANS